MAALYDVRVRLSACGCDRCRCQGWSRGGGRGTGGSGGVSSRGGRCRRWGRGGRRGLGGRRAWARSRRSGRRKKRDYCHYPVVGTLLQESREPDRGAYVPGGGGAGNAPRLRASRGMEENAAIQNHRSVCGLATRTTGKKKLATTSITREPLTVSEMVDIAGKMGPVSPELTMVEATPVAETAPPTIPDTVGERLTTTAS